MLTFLAFCWRLAACSAGGAARGDSSSCGRSTPIVVKAAPSLREKPDAATRDRRHRELLSAPRPSTGPFARRYPAFPLSKQPGWNVVLAAANKPPSNDCVSARNPKVSVPSSNEIFRFPKTGLNVYISSGLGVHGRIRFERLREPRRPSTCSMVKTCGASHLSRKAATFARGLVGHSYK